MLLTTIVYLIFAVLLICAAIEDLNTSRIPNAVVAALLVLWCFWRLALAFGGLLVGVDFLTALLAPAAFKEVSLAGGIVGSVTLGGCLLLFSVLYEYTTEKRAIGGGDIKLLFAVGLFLGFERSLACLFSACLISLMLAFLLPHTRWSGTDLIRKDSSYPIMRTLPFGPSIAIGAALALLLI